MAAHSAHEPAATEKGGLRVILGTTKYRTPQ
jgi:hypothetical protein